MVELRKPPQVKINYERLLEFARHPTAKQLAAAWGLSKSTADARRKDVASIKKTSLYEFEVLCELVKESPLSFYEEVSHDT